MCVTVVIPTFRRAEYLRVALQSVKHQTALHQIDHIIVSENSDDTASKSVCQEFSDLPITYFQQHPQITAVEHLSWIFEQSKSEYTAMLHDDDWWYPTHLETGINALQKNKNSVCYFSNFIFAENELLKNSHLHHENLISYLGLSNKNLELIKISLSDICTLAFLCTPFHFSSIIGRTKNLLVTINDSLKMAKPYYADRILYPSLAVQGELLFNVQLLVGVRKHQSNDNSTISLSDKYLSHLEGSEKIQQLAKAHGIDVLKSWEKVKRNCLEQEWNEILNIYATYFGATSQKENDVFFRPYLKMKTPLVRRIINKLKTVF
jgi:glycosyltransferase involved in cell wall biosynthesis